MILDANLLLYARNSADPRHERAARSVEQWLAAPAAWVPVPTPRHGEVLLALVHRLCITGALITDAHRAALALEHGVAVWTTDADFARFEGLTWHDLLR